MAGYYTPGADISAHRRRLPHWEQKGVWCFVTFRLADSLPKELTQKCKIFSSLSEDQKRKNMILIENALDQGLGSQRLAEPLNAQLLSNVLRSKHGLDYVLDSFAIMPNHVHILFHPKNNTPIPKVLQSWKGCSARAINSVEGSAGRLWQPEYWDRLIRDQRHFHRCRNYIHKNPEKAGLSEGFVVWQAERGL